MDIDLFNPKSYAHGQPHDQFAWLREHDPVHWQEEPNGPGYWALTRYDDVFQVDRDYTAFSSEPTIMIADGGGGQMGPYKMMLMMDPPEHAAFRRLIRGEFTLPSAKLRSDRIAELARQIVDAVIEKGECDFVHDIAGEMPSFVIAELMGMPLEDGRELYKLTEAIHTAPEAQAPGAGGAAVAKMFEYGSRLMAEKRAKPGDDLASRLLACEVDGRRLDDMEFLLFFLLLIDAGGDTTRNLLAGGLIALMDNPDQHAWLMQDLPGRLHTAREEMLRWTSPVIYMRRTARHDVELDGKTIKAGDKAVMYFGSANRDPAKFDRPDTLDLSRPDNAHIAFGGGAHVCLGQHIARIEIDAMLIEVLSRMQDVRTTEAPVWLASNFISGPKDMPVTFKPAAAGRGVITLYGSSHGRPSRCLVALEELGVPYRQVVLKPWESEADRQTMAGLNPMGRVPVLDDDGLVLYESMAINLYLGDRYGGPIWPAGARERAKLYQWSLWTQTEVDVMVRHRARFGSDPERKRRAEEERLAALAVIDAALADRPYLLGEAFTLADVNVATTLCEPWEGGRIDGELDPADHGLAALAGWLQRCTARPSWARVAALP